MADVDWSWDAGENRWRAARKRQIWAPTSGWRRWFSDGKWYECRTIVSVAGRSDSRDANACTCVDGYAAKVAELESAITNHLEGFPVKVYGGYKDNNQWDVITHVERPTTDIDRVDIPDISQPERVHIHFDTYYPGPPHPYYSYEAVLEAGAIVEVKGELSYW